MTEKVHNLTESQLQNIIRDAILEAGQTKTRAITSKNLFDDVKFNDAEVGVINRNNSKIIELLGEKNVTNIFCNTPRITHWGHEYRKVYTSDIRDNIRKLTLNVFGKTLNSDLTRDEYALAQEFYSQLVDWYLSAYRKRLEELYQKEKSD